MSENTFFQCEERLKEHRTNCHVQRNATAIEAGDMTTDRAPET